MLFAIGLLTFVRTLVYGSAAVALETVALRHQLIVLKRSVNRRSFSAWPSGIRPGVGDASRRNSTSLAMTSPN